jgi:hypothetical protein
MNRRVRVTMLLAGTMALQLGCGAGDAPSGPGTWAKTLGPVVYGEDDRVDWYEVAAEPDRALARGASVAMVPYSRIRYEADGGVTLTSAETLGERHDLCAAERFREDPTSASCSGTLIDDDLVLTAGHCVEDLDDCARNAFVFDYLYEAPGVRPVLDRDDVYRCAALVMQGGVDTPEGLDLAIVQLERPVVGRVPAEVARFVGVGDAAAGGSERGALGVGEGLWMVGYPSGIPMKVDAGGAVADTRAARMDYFVASVDAFRGNSGSGVFDEARRLMGVLTDGAEDYRNLGSCRGVAVLDPEDAEEGVHYAHRAVETLCAKGFPSARLCGDTEGTCGDGFCEVRERAAGAEGEGNVEACADDCDGLWAVPAEWTCSSRWYARGDDCDCDCGARDPDCDDPTLDVYGCASESACTAEGVCEVRIPDEWTCRDSWYAVGDDCDCNCGAWDPDCADETLKTFGCVDGGSCMEDGRCTTGPPDGWTCAPRSWGAGDGCQCGCGAWDPDCDGAGGDAVEGCATGSGCRADGACEVPIPEGWVCADEVFGDGDRCDCNCGARDPDCDRVGVLVLNCGTGGGCGPDGECVTGAGGPEPGPEASGDAGVMDTETAGGVDTADVDEPLDGTVHEDLAEPRDAAPRDGGPDAAGDAVDGGDEDSTNGDADADSEENADGGGEDAVSEGDVAVRDAAVPDAAVPGEVVGPADATVSADATVPSEVVGPADAGTSDLDASSPGRVEPVAGRRIRGGGGGCGGGGARDEWWAAALMLAWLGATRRFRRTL